MLRLYIQAKEASCPLWFAAKVVATLENQEAGIQNEDWVSAMNLTGCRQAKIVAKMQQSTFLTESLWASVKR